MENQSWRDDLRPFLQKWPGWALLTLFWVVGLLSIPVYLWNGFAAWWVDVMMETSEIRAGIKKEREMKKHNKS